MVSGVGRQILALHQSQVLARQVGVILSRSLQAARLLRHPGPVLHHQLRPLFQAHLRRRLSVLLRLPLLAAGIKTRYPMLAKIIALITKSETLPV
jgi:hypothetical protein